MKLVTFNVRKDVAADGGNRFLERRESIVQQIHREMPDVIGFQEVEAPAEQWLKEHLPEYEFVGHGRAADLTNEAVPVAFRRERARRLRAQLAFKDSVVRGILQFTPSIAFRYVLHRNTATTPARAA